MNGSAPAQFDVIGLDSSRFRKVGREEWHGPCPFCGGTKRFIIFTTRVYPSWNWACRHCTPLEKGTPHWIDEINGSLRREIPQAQRDVWKREREDQERRDNEQRRQKLAQFSTRELWLELHERLTEENYRWYESQGIPRDWVNFYKLGYMEEKQFKHQGETLTSPAYTFPKYDLDWVVTNTDYRLTNFPENAGKYRMQGGIPASTFCSRPDMSEMADQVFIIEGTKKAIVTMIEASAVDGELHQYWAVPSCNSWAGIVDRVKDKVGRAWILMDPDADIYAWKMAREIGKAARVVELPTKPDDAWLSHEMTAGKWAAYLRDARGVG